MSGILRHELQGRQPIILYASHPDFEQTNAIPDEIGETTGGVTEALKRRVVLPLAGPLGETDHVLGHELVHAFQFDITAQGPSDAGYEIPGALRLPLWFVEGMAEYLSLGPVDAHTAMWMRDAAIREDLPPIRRWTIPVTSLIATGTLFWAYVAGEWGDRAIGRILMNAGRFGTPEEAFEIVLGVRFGRAFQEMAGSGQPANTCRSSKPAWIPTEIGRRILTEQAGESEAEHRAGNQP